jgi:hypothetical protein
MPHAAAPSPESWPAHPGQLLDTRLCPACFTGLTDATCPTCALDLRSPLSASLLELGRVIVATNVERRGVIDEIRRTAAARSSVAATSDHNASTVGAGTTDPFLLPASPSPGVPASALEPASPPRSDSAGAPRLEQNLRAEPPLRSGPPLSAGKEPAQPPRRRRSGIQVLLLTAGVVLLSVFAVFFAVLAYVAASIETRSVLTAGASLAVVGVAWLLRRRALAATAEGVAVVGVVLLLLDVWIVRANRLFSVDRMDVWLYTGVALLVVVALLFAVARLSGLRSPSISVSAILPIGVFAIVVGASSPLDDGAAGVLLGASAATITVLAERITNLPAAERVTLRILSLGAGTLALVPALFAFSGLIAGGVLAFGVASVAWLVQLFAVSGQSARSPGSSVWGVLASSGLAVSLSGFASAAAGIAAPDDVVAGGLRPVSVGIVALAVLASSRLTPPLLAHSLRICGLVLSGLGAAMLVAPLVLVSDAVLSSLQHPLFSVGLLDPYADGAPSGGGASENLGWAVVGITLSAAVSAATVRLLRSPERPVRGSWVPVVLIAAAAVGGALWCPMAPAALGIGVVAASLLLVAASRSALPTSARAAAWGAALVIALLVAAQAGAQTESWVFALLAVLTLLVVARSVALAGGRGRAVLGATVTSVIATVVVLSAGAIAPTWVARVLGLPDDTTPGFGTLVAASAILLALAFALRVVARAEAIAIGVLGGTAAVLCGALVAWDDDYSFAAGRAAAFALLALGAVVWWRRRDASAVHPVAAVSLVPSLALASANFTNAVALPGLAGAGVLAATASLALVAGVSLAVDARRSTAPRAGTPDGSVGRRVEARIAVRSLDCALLVVTAIAVALAVALPAPIRSIVFLVAGVVPVIIAARASTSERRVRPHLAWLGVLLATASLWTLLVEERVELIEAYSLPVAGLLLAIGAVAAARRVRVTRADGAAREGGWSGADAILAAALAIGILPSAIASGTDGATRGIVIVLVGVLLLVLSQTRLAAPPELRLRLLAWSAGVAAVAVPPVVRALGGSARTSEAPFEWWLTPSAAVLIVAGLAAWKLRRGPGLAPTALIAAVVSTSVTLAVVARTIDLSGIDVAAWLLVVCLVGVVASLPSGRRWTATVAAAIAGVVVIATATLPAVDHVECVTVPVGLSALTAGALRLRRNAASRSWPTLAPGLLVLFVPSLLHDLGDTTLWRAVALGVLAFCTLAIGFARRLQAPLVLGGITLITHGIAQLWPWISDVYESGYWWLWAGVGGIVLVVVAARYERSVQALRSAEHLLRSLR